MEAKPFKLGYVGVGLMGRPMVQRLLKLGWRVRAYDIVAERIAQSGALACASAAEAARDVDMVLLNLPTNQAVEEAVFAKNGLVEALRPPQLVVDFSTIPVEACRSHGARLEKMTGCRWVDTPVSGGPPASAAGTLTVMAGGTEEDIARLAPLMQDVAGPLHTHGWRRRGPGGEDDQPARGRRGPRHAGGGRGAVRESRHRRGAHSGLPRGRLRRQQPDEGLLAADGAARLRSVLMMEVLHTFLVPLVRSDA
jgi:hypothetical protein